MHIEQVVLRTAAVIRYMGVCVSAWLPQVTDLTELLAGSVLPRVTV